VSKRERAREKEPSSTEFVNTVQEEEFARNKLNLVAARLTNNNFKVISRHPWVSHEQFEIFSEKHHHE
jgi:hypothetical protein